MRIAIIGAGAIGECHLKALQRDPEAEIATIVSGTVEEADKLAQPHGISDTGDSLERVLERSDVDAVILCTPTQMHAGQAMQCLDAGKHVLVEIPIADNWGDAQALQQKAAASDLVCMAGHTSRFYPSSQYMHRLIADGDFTLQQMDVQTYFLRRSNLNAKGEPRSWTDHLLWHHAAHTVDLFAWQSGPIVKAQAMQGPLHPELGIAMDMSIQLMSASGALCTLSLSFNNDGPLGSTVRYIGDSGTYVGERLALHDGWGKVVDYSGLGLPEDGVEGQDREFLSAIAEGRKPEASIDSVFDCYRVLAGLEEDLEQG